MFTGCLRFCFAFVSWFTFRFCIVPGELTTCCDFVVYSNVLGCLLWLVVDVLVIGDFVVWWDYCELLVCTYWCWVYDTEITVLLNAWIWITDFAILGLDHSLCFGVIYSFW